MNGMNPFQLIGMMKNGNPQQVAMSLLNNNKNLPFASNMVQMIQNNDQKGLENMARNLAKEKNVDIEQMLSQINNMCK